jgi:hypothetical protein
MHTQAHTNLDAVVLHDDFQVGLHERQVANESEAPSEELRVTVVVLDHLDDRSHAQLGNLQVQGKGAEL